MRQGKMPPAPSGKLCHSWRSLIRPHRTRLCGRDGSPVLMWLKMAVHDVGTKMTDDGGRRATRPIVAPVAWRLQRAQEVQQVLLVGGGEMVVVVDYPVSFRLRILVVALAGVRVDRLYQVGSAAVVHEKDSLPQSPKRRGAEFVAVGDPLTDVVGQVRTHVVQ